MLPYFIQSCILNISVTSGGQLITSSSQLYSSHLNKTSYSLCSVFQSRSLWLVGAARGWVGVVSILALHGNDVCVRGRASSFMAAGRRH